MTRQRMHDTPAPPTPRPPRWRRALLFALCETLGPIAAVEALQAEQERVVLVGATLVDPHSRRPLPRTRIVISGETFSCVSSEDGCPPMPGDSVVDLTGLWITPGLIDTHVHLDCELAPNRTLEAQALRFALGITTVRDGGSLQLEAVLPERERARAGEHASPRIVIAERPTSPYDARYGTERGAALVERLRDLGVDQIKVKDHVQDDSLFLEEIRTAERLGLPVYGHTWRAPPPRSLTSLAIREGLDGVSHLESFAYAAYPGSLPFDPPPEDSPEIWQWHKNLWMRADQDALDRAAAEMIDYGVWLEPLLVTEHYWEQPLRPPPVLDFLSYAPPPLTEVLTGRSVLAEPHRPTFPAPYAAMARFVRDFAERGGMVVAGTDDLRPGLDLHAEIRLLREAGLAPMEALRAATSNAAIALGRSDIGAVEVGRLADAVVYDSDPLTSASGTLDVRYVIKGGYVHRAFDLLEPARSRYAGQVRAVWLRRAGRLLVLFLAAALTGFVIVWAIRTRRSPG